jgi:TM2 domain-containing membrane protein YozV
MSQSVAWAALLILSWLGLGVLGYHHFLRLRWVDALVNASMIMSGMGPVDPMQTDSAKVFASIYAVLSGVVFLSTFAIVATPLAHRILHVFHHRTKVLGAKNNPARS